MEIRMTAIRILSTAAVSAAALLAASPATMAREPGMFTPTFTSVCAAHDIRTFAVIEKAGERAGVPASRLGDAGLAYLRARLLCLSGHEADGVAAYESAVAAIASAGPEAGK
jgi:hypothetical protein